MPFGLPTDVRVMNLVSSVVAAGVALGLLLGALLWLTRSPWFAIRSIDLQGELTRNSVNTIRANAMPALQGNFFSVDLQQARRAFEAVPWVRHAVVRRVWPGRLAVTLEEHRAAALWQADERSDRLVNDQGEVFEANVGDVEDEALPIFSGPEGSAALMLTTYRRLLPVFAAMKVDIDSLSLSSRGSWRVDLDSGAVIELGRGQPDELGLRAERFVRSLPQVGARFVQQPLEYADLRHTDGYAVRLRGVSTQAAAPATPTRKP
jgi:cell division protein FtsQ